MALPDTTPTPELPSLDPGLQLLETCSETCLSALHALVIDHVLLNNGQAYWVDSGHHAVTNNLRDIAPNDRVLDRIKVARGFTRYQHTAIVRHLPETLRDDASLLVVPTVDYHYRGDDVRGHDPQAMLTRGLAELARIARDHDLAVLLTRHRADEFSQPVESLVDRTLTYRDTACGPRFEGDDFETMLYDLGDGWVQTTWAFWRDILAERESLYEGHAARQRFEAGAYGAH